MIIYIKLINFLKSQLRSRFRLRVGNRWHEICTYSRYLASISQNQEWASRRDLVLDAANTLAQQRDFYAFEYNGTYFDTGDKFALLKTAKYFLDRDQDLK